MKFLTALAAMLAASALAADSPAPIRFPSIKLADGTEYRDCLVRGATPAELHVTCLNGYVRIPLAKLPPDLQARFNYDPAKAALWKSERGITAESEAKFEAERAAYLAKKRNAPAVEAEKRAKRDASAVRMVGKVVEVTRGGVWLADARPVDASPEEEGRTIFVHTDSPMNKGVIFSAKMWLVGDAKRDEPGRKVLAGQSYTTTPPL